MTLQDSARTRSHSLDVLRGLVVVLAMLEHFSYFLSVWSLSYLKIGHVVDPRYAVMRRALEAGQPAALSPSMQWVFEQFGGWVNHSYVFLAAFNIAWLSRSQVRARLAGRLKVFLALFVFFTLEGAITSATFGEAFSVYPLQMWMLILALLNVVYVWLGLWGAVLVFGLSWLRFVVPWGELSGAWQDFMREAVHGAWEYDARLEYFLGSGALGLVFGALLHQFAERRTALLWGGVGIGTLGIVLHQLFGSSLRYDPQTFYGLEHAWVQTVGGSLYIWSCCLFVTSVFLALEGVVPFQKAPLLRWVGLHSLFVFALHKILFVHLVMPLYEWWLASRGLGVSINFPVVLTLTAACLGLTWLLQKLRVFEIVVGKGRP